jgi:predicted alpha/beta superfamily hydrolase
MSKNVRRLCAKTNFLQMFVPATAAPAAARFSTHSMLTLELFTPNDDARPVFVTGSFNGWATRDARFAMSKIGDGRYEYTFQELLPTTEPFEYKYVKGGWESEELDPEGLPPTNRRMEVPRGKVADIVPRWKEHSEGYDPKFYPDIQIVAKRFNAPQLRRRRRISVLLPWDYASSGRRYPVLYLQDGQNLFEEGAPFGTWGVDKRLAALAQHGRGDFIVVAIDHGGQERIREFSPYDSQRWGEGLGQEYAGFLAETLKPHIDRHFRTQPDRGNTAIGGSSMGGLISIYAGIFHPEVFSKFMIFSPSLWAAPKVYFEPIRFSPFSATKIYLYAGGKEGAGVVANARRFKEEIEKKGYDPAQLQVRLEVNPQGRHTEARWGEEFPKAAEWLFH